MTIKNPENLKSFFLIKIVHFNIGQGLINLSRSNSFCSLSFTANKTSTFPDYVKN